MSDTARKPLPPALKALKPILDALSLEFSEGDQEIVNIKDFTVRETRVSSRAKVHD